jgi:hypothetical protein
MFLYNEGYDSEIKKINRFTVIFEVSLINRWKLTSNGFKNEIHQFIKRKDHTVG